MPQIFLTITPQNLQRFILAAKVNHPIPMDDDGKPKYTDAKWARKRINKLMAREVFIAEKSAEVSNVTEDKNFVDVE